MCNKNKKPTRTAFNVQYNSDIVDDMPKSMSQHEQSAETLYDIEADNHTSDLNNDNDELYNDFYDDNDKHMHFLTDYPLYDTCCIEYDNHSWDNTFIAHDFTSHQICIMEYFNIRYKCLNARYDCITI
jgi:hypothetical protein